MQAQNKYIAPDFDPDKHKSINGYAGKSVVPKTVRIELPWSIFCGHCDAHVAKGVRYNARKKESGKYFSTRIFEFHFTCHLCSGPIVMKTDPEHRDYAIVSGAKRKVESYDPQDARTIELMGEKEKAKLAQDPMFHLEHKAKDQDVAKNDNEHLEKLLEMRSDQFEMDYRASRLIRSGFRKRKAEEIAEEKKNKAKGIHVPLVPENDDDVVLAMMTKFKKKPKPEIAKNKPASVFGKKVSSGPNNKKRATLPVVVKKK